MDYTKDMKKAAHRHFQAANDLPPNHAKIAGYLYGIAAECAIKAAMINSGMRPRPVDERRDDPFYAHFETLKTLLRDTVSGRLSTELRRYADNTSFMQYWDTSMRYSDGSQIDSRWVARWRENALQAMNAMDS